MGSSGSTERIIGGGGGILNKNNMKNLDGNYVPRDLSKENAFTDYLNECVGIFKL